MPKFDRYSNLLDTAINKYLSADLLRKWIEKRRPSYKGRDYRTQSPMYAHPEVFIATANKYGINGAFFWAHAINESAYGLSDFALSRNNFWGIDARDSNPNEADSYANLLAGVEAGASLMRWGYFDPNGFAWKKAVAHGKKVLPSVDSMDGIWWSSATQDDTIVYLVNDLMGFVLSQQAAPPTPPVVQPTQPTPQNTEEFYYVKKGGWRSQVIQEVIDAGIWSGSWVDNQPRFFDLNPEFRSSSPQGGWSPTHPNIEGRRVRVKRVEVPVPQTVVLEPSTPIEVVLNDPAPVASVEPTPVVLPSEPVTLPTVPDLSVTIPVEIPAEVETPMVEQSNQQEDVVKALQEEINNLNRIITNFHVGGSTIEIPHTDVKDLEKLVTSKLPFKVKFMRESKDLVKHLIQLLAGLFTVVFVGMALHADRNTVQIAVEGLASFFGGSKIAKFVIGLFFEGTVVLAKAYTQKREERLHPVQQQIQEVVKL